MPFPRGMPGRRTGELPPIPGVGPTGEQHCPGGFVYRFVVRRGAQSRATPLEVGSYYRKCMGCGSVLPDDPPDC